MEKTYTVYYEFGSGAQNLKLIAFDLTEEDIRDIELGESEEEVIKYRARDAITSHVFKKWGKSATRSINIKWNTLDLFMTVEEME